MPFMNIELMPDILVVAVKLCTEPVRGRDNPHQGPQCVLKYGKIIPQESTQTRVIEKFHPVCIVTAFNMYDGPLCTV